MDNGVTNHSDLNANVLPGYDFTWETPGGDGRNTGVPDGMTCSAEWHGTHIAGIMARLTNNGIGIAGVAPAAKIVSARAQNGCSKGSISAAADAIVWAAGGTVQGAPTNSHPAQVINASFGAAGSCSATLQNAIDYATSRGAIVVAAAMNGGDDAANYQPANCHNAITVGNSSTDGARSTDSNFGPIVDIAAPGARIWSTYDDGTRTPGAESYAYRFGTSMSAGMVSGVVALAQAIAPVSLTGPEMRTLLQQQAQPFPVFLDEPIGAGIVDATATVAAAKAGKVPAAADFTCSEAPNLMQVTCRDMSTARGDAPIKSWVWSWGDGSADYVFNQSINAVKNFDYAGTYVIRLTVTDSNGAKSTLARPLSVLPPAISDVSVDAPVTVVARNGDMLYYRLIVPTGAKNLTASLAPSNEKESAWLYTRASTPSVLYPDCQAHTLPGVSATCTIPNPTPGTYYFIVAAQSRLTASILKATYSL